jgi:hypothetical protein
MGDRRLSAVLPADVVGYSWLVTADEAGTRAVESMQRSATLRSSFLRI